MEPSQFDDLAKALATSTSRRAALKALAATTLGGILGLSGLGTAFADKTCKKLGQGCNNKKNLCCPGLICQGGICVACTANGGTCSGSSDCCSGTCCQGICCASGQVCLSNGTCATPCTSESDPCSGSCGTGICSGDNSGAALYCWNGTPFISDCTTDSTCPKGYFCSDGGGCIAVC